MLMWLFFHCLFAYVKHFEINHIGYKFEVYSRFEVSWFGLKEFEQRVLGMHFHSESNYNESGNEINNKTSVYQHLQAEKEKHSTEAMIGHDGEAQ